MLAAQSASSSDGHKLFAVVLLSGGHHDLACGVGGGGDDYGEPAEVEQDQRAMAACEIAHGAVRQVPGEVVEVAKHGKRPRGRRQTETDGRAEPPAASEEEEREDGQERSKLQGHTTIVAKITGQYHYW
jgi:hypothetical protein